MRRQCMRLFCNFNYRYSVPLFQYSQTKAQKLISECLKDAAKLNFNQESNVHLYLELQEKIWQIKPILNQMTIGELQDLVNFTFSLELEDEGYASKVFERATELYIQEKSTMKETLSVLSKIINNKYSKMHYQQQYSFLAAAAQAPALEPAEIGLGMFIYGQLQNHLRDRDLDIERSLIIHFKMKIDQFQSNDLKHFAFGVLLAQIRNLELFELLERKALQIPLTFPDFIRIATAVGIFGSGSDQFWKLFEETAVKEISKTTPDNLATLIMFYKQCGHVNRKLLTLLADNFVRNYSKFNYFQKLQMFSGFAKLKHPSTEVFSLFLRDVKRVIDHSGIVAVQMLIYDCLSIFPTFPKPTQKLFFDFILNHNEQMNVTIKRKIYENFKTNNILTPELEVVLEQPSAR